jgi:hypothetical protein
MDLGIDDGHRGISSVPREFGYHSRFVSRGLSERARRELDFQQNLGVLICSQTDTTSL